MFLIDSATSQKLNMFTFPQFFIWIYDNFYSERRFRKFKISLSKPTCNKYLTGTSPIIPANKNIYELIFERFWLRIWYVGPEGFRAPRTFQPRLDNYFEYLSD